MVSPPAFRWRCCPRSIGIYAIVLLVSSPSLHLCCCQHCPGIFAVVPLASLPSLRHCHCFAGIVAWAPSSARLLAQLLDWQLIGSGLGSRVGSCLVLLSALARQVLQMSCRGSAPGASRACPPRINAVVDHPWAPGSARLSICLAWLLDWLWICSRRLSSWLCSCSALIGKYCKRLGSLLSSWLGS